MEEKRQSNNYSDVFLPFILSDLKKFTPNSMAQNKKLVVVSIEQNETLASSNFYPEIEIFLYIVSWKIISK